MTATKLCVGECRRVLPLEAFQRDARARDGRRSRCRECSAAPAAARGPTGRPMHAARDGDKRQARRRIRQLVQHGVIPPASALPCVDCGAQAREYDHYLGYAAEHHEDVEAVCRRDHNIRSIRRGERRRHRSKMGA